MPEEISSPPHRDLRSSAGRIAAALAVGLIALVLAGLYFSGFTRHTKFDARKRQCASNLSQIGKALSIYADIGEHMGRFPPKLSDLYPGIVTDPRVFLCPNCAKGQEGAAEGPVPRIDFVYRPGHTESHTTEPIAYCVHCGRGEGGNVLMGDERVEWYEGALPLPPPPAPPGANS
ncbi:MAG: hypothetical protein M5U26_28305 [Planctomycetota bacterium]|nr:hypothetical protein [Planctomycetota bacterium]